jgi:hypothetical protein
MNPVTTNTAPDLSLFDELSALLGTRLAYHQAQLQHHQQRMAEIEDMNQYLAARFAPMPDEQSAPAEAVDLTAEAADITAGRHTPVETSIESAMTELHADPAAPDADLPADETAPSANETSSFPEDQAAPGHQTFGYQSMY